MTLASRFYFSSIPLLNLTLIVNQKYFFVSHWCNRLYFFFVQIGFSYSKLTQLEIKKERISASHHVRLIHQKIVPAQNDVNEEWEAIHDNTIVHFLQLSTKLVFITFIPPLYSMFRHFSMRRFQHFLISINWTTGF